LQDLTLEFNTGEIVTIIGPNGAGKSTLAKLLLGILTPTSGEIKRRLNLKLGYVPQKFNIDPSFPMTVERFLKMLAKPLVDDIFNIKSLMKSQISALSGGELQRVLMTRAFLQEPNVLVLDEPTQGVDVLGQKVLYEKLINFQELTKCSVILVSHDLHLVFSKSHRVICLNQHICCSGHPDDVMTHPSYLDLFGPLASYTHTHDHAHDV
jgi:zinc transport system ATP-binding protein